MPADILFCSRLCPSTAGSSPPPEPSDFLCPLLSLPIPLPVDPTMSSLQRHFGFPTDLTPFIVHSELLMVYNNNNNPTERANSRFFTISPLRRDMSPTLTLKWPVRSLCKSRATRRALITSNMSCATCPVVFHLKLHDDSNGSPSSPPHQQT